MTQVDQILKDFIAGRDDLGVGFIGALSGDELRELAGQIHIRHFQRTGDQAAQTVAARRHWCCQGSGKRHSGIKIVAHARQLRRWSEILQQDLPANILGAIGKLDIQLPVGAKGVALDRGSVTAGCIGVTDLNIPNSILNRP